MFDGWHFGGLLMVGLAAFRVWVLLARDSVLAPVRARLPGGVVGWLECPWCGGFWVSVVVFVGVEVFGPAPWVTVGVVVAGLSAVVGLLGVWLVEGAGE